jgi:hypothetical protein
MISRDKIYDWLQELVAASAVDAPLADAVLFPNLKGSIDETQKVIRVDCWAGEFTLTEEPEREERNVDFVIQCVVTPDEGSDELRSTGRGQGNEFSNGTDDLSEKWHRRDSRAFARHTRMSGSRVTQVSELRIEGRHIYTGR